MTHLRSLLLLATLVLPSCNLPKRYDPEWVDDQVKTGSERVLWEVTVLALDKEGFPVGSGIDPTTRIATSGWRSSLYPFRGEGYRERAEVQYVPAEPGVYDMRVRVRRQNNMDIVRPLDLRFAEWEDAPDNVPAAKILAQLIQSFLGQEFELSEPRDPLEAYRSEGD